MGNQTKTTAKLWPDELRENCPDCDGGEFNRRELTKMANGVWQCHGCGAMYQDLREPHAE